MDCGRHGPPLRGRDNEASPSVLLTRLLTGRKHLWCYGGCFPPSESRRGGSAGLSGPASSDILLNPPILDLMLTLSSEGKT